MSAIGVVFQHERGVLNLRAALQQLVLHVWYHAMNLRFPKTILGFRWRLQLLVPTVSGITPEMGETPFLEKFQSSAISDLWVLAKPDHRMESL